MKKHLQTFDNYQQDDWLEKLAMAEFATNNNESAFTKLSPFLASKGLYSRMNFVIVEFFDINTHKRIYKYKDSEISENMETTQEFVQKAIASAQEIQLKQVDKH